MHDIYRSWRKVAGEFGPGRVFVAEAWVDRPDRLARYVRPDELHTAFNFEFLLCDWDAGALREVIDRTLERWTRSAHPRPGCCPTTTSSGT